MLDLIPYIGPAKLILAFDIGTTFSTVSYAILEPHQVPQILTVPRFPAQRVACADDKVPSLLYYDKTGIVRAAGAEVLAQSIIETALAEGWTKAEWWKLHLCPKHLASSIHPDDDIPQLPPGKSAVDILTDFIKYLFNCSKTYILECHPSFPWSSVEHSTEYILTYPGGWAEQEYLYYQAIVCAGLVPSTVEGQLRVHMLTEGEASLHFCASLLDGETANQAAQGVVIVDAGGGLVDLSMFSMTSNPVSCEEIAPAESRLQGSVFVTRRARALIESKLRGWERSSAEDITQFTREFDQTGLVIENDRKPVYIRVADCRTNSPRYRISSGRLKLSGEEATSVFNDSVDAIISAFEQQQSSAETPVTTAFFVGGLSANEWVWSQLQPYFMNKDIKVLRPANHTNEVVAKGAALSGVAFSMRGVGCALPIKEAIGGRLFRRLTGGLSNHTSKVATDCVVFPPVDRDYYLAIPKAVHRRYEMIRRNLWHTKAQKADLEKAVETSNGKIAHLEKTVAELDAKLANERDDLNLTTECLQCAALYDQGCVLDAARSLLRVTSTPSSEGRTNKQISPWVVGFQRRCLKKLNKLGDEAMDSQRYNDAVEHFSTMLSLNPPDRIGILVKRSKARMSMKLWQEALDDAEEMIILDPSSPWGYEVKHAASYQVGDYSNAVDALETMLSKMAESPDPQIQQRRDQYVSPSITRATIHKIVQRTVRRSPRVLINTETGRLHDRSQRASAFEALPIFSELVSSMTKRIDYVRIKREVRQYFRYVMLSHKWEDNEPLFQQVVHTTVYDLDKSPTHDKLQTFCKIVRDAEFTWAWSDTCCINKSDHFIFQEALVAMFKWYQGSAMVIVFLRGVRFLSRRGALASSAWNTRAWTLQEYIASKIILFYTEDWTPYLDLQLPDHKTCTEIILEMEEATGISAQQLRTLRPGLTSIREKLRLASTRQTTHVEDAAYSLLGIFSVTSIPAIYGEGKDSLARLLAHILTGSGNTSILAWTGQSSTFNSFLPAYITMFNEPASSHIPPSISDDEMEGIITSLRISSFDLDAALRLYDRLNGLPAPWFAAFRMKLPCIAFELPPLTSCRTCSGRLYCVDTVAFGKVEIKTRYDISKVTTLYLIHPWLDAVLDRGDAQNGEVVGDDSPDTDVDEMPDEGMDNNVLEPEPLSLPAPGRTVPVMDREMRARRLAALLRQPFGALLVTLAPEGRPEMDYRRIATDSLITVRFQDSVSLADLLANVRVLDVL